MSYIFVTLFFLSFLFLFIGIFYPKLFTNKKTGTIPSRKRLAMGWGAAAFIFLVLTGITTPSSSTSPQNNLSKNVLQANKDILKFPAAADVLAGNNNDSPPQPKLRSFEYNSTTQSVNVAFNIDQSFSSSAASDTIKLEMSDIYIALFHDSKIPVQFVSVDAWGPAQDQYGNTSYKQYVGTTMRRDVADKINWSLDKSTLELQIIPGLWCTYLGNRSLGWTESGSCQ